MKRKSPQQQPARPRKYTRNPCEVCGWSECMAIHQPKEKPWGHAFRPMPAQTKEAQP